MLYLNDCLDAFDLDAAYAQLSEQRLAQALRFRHEFGRRTCVAVYLLLRKALREEYGIDEKPLFEYGQHGKPSIVGHSDIHFSFSHCRKAVACMVSNRPVGVDIEVFRPCREALMRHTMSTVEQDLICRSDRQDIAFTRLWTMKEAVAKLSGEGLQAGIKTMLKGNEKVETTVNFEKEYVYSVAFG